MPPSPGCRRWWAGGDRFVRLTVALAIATGIAAVVAGLLRLGFLTGLFETLPEATLAAVVIAAVIELIDIPGLVTLYQVATRQLRGIYGVAARPDFLAALAALLGVLIVDTLPGLVIGIAVSLLLLYRASRPHVAVLGQVPGAAGHYGDILRHPENRQVPGIVVLSPGERAVLRQRRRRPRHHPRPHRRALGPSRGRRTASWSP